MLTDNVTWLLFSLRNKNAFFSRASMGGKIFLIAGNRAARRVLGSKSIQKQLAAKGAQIDFTDYSVG